jgi:hypothetical protein
MPIDLDKKAVCTDILNSTLDRMLKAIDENFLVCKVVIQLIKQGYYAVPEWYSERRGHSLRPDIVINDEIAVEVKRTYFNTIPLNTGIGQCVRYLRHYKEAWLIVDTEKFREEMVWIRTLLPNIRFWIITTDDILQEVK